NRGLLPTASVQSPASRPPYKKSIPMSEQEKVDKARRGLIVASSIAGGAVAAGAAVPFVWSMFPSERAKAAGAPVEAEIAALAPGELKVFEWRGKPVWVLKRTKEMLASLKAGEGRLQDP